MNHELLLEVGFSPKEVRSGWEWNESEAAFLGDGEMALPGLALGEDSLGESDKVAG
jgi:hypothetical protein